MYNCQVVLYAQTGFNGVDIPDSIQTLQRNFDPYKIYDDINIIQGEYIASIILDDLTPDEARRIDYITIKDKDTEYRTCNCYTIESFEFLADGTCQFNLYIDAYNTLGGFADDSGNQVLGGSAKRLSVSIEEDNTKYFINPEPFAPAEKNKTEFVKLINKPPIHMPNEILIIETLTIPPITVEGIFETQVENKETKTIDDIKLEKYSNKQYQHRIMGLGIGENITITEHTTELGKVKALSYTEKITPQSRKMKETEITLLSGEGSYTYKTGSRWWVAENAKGTATLNGKVVESDVITDMRNAGRDNDIVAYWAIPTIYYQKLIQSTTNYSLIDENNYGGIDNITNRYHAHNFSYTPIQVYNNKARYKQSAEIKVFCSASGQEINKEVYEVLATGTSPQNSSYGISVVITADLRPQGSPIFYFTYNNQTLQTENLCEHIKGANWRQISLGINGVSGLNQRQAEIKAEKEMANKSGLFSLFGGLALLGIGIATGGASAGATGLAKTLIPVGASAIGLGGKELVKANWRQQEQQDILNSASINASSLINIGSSEYCRDTGNNIFWGMITQYSDEDMVAYDTFLTRYGYNVGNKVLKQTDFYSRPAFNFVQINDIDIESVTGSLQMIEMCKQQLKAGVRIWHTKPNYNDMLASGNRG